MHEYETFVYLDVQKTGSSYICSVLKRFCTEKEVRTRLHLGVEDDRTSNKFHFISVRDPLDQYISLYSFGCQTSGLLFKHLHRKGFGDLYDGTWRGFRRWLDFILDAENAQLLAGEYGTETSSNASSLLGFLSYRVLTLAMRGGPEKIAACNNADEITSAYRASNIVEQTLRNETLREDLAGLLRGRLRNSISDLDAALAYVETAEPLNISDRVDRYESNPKLGKGRKRLLEEREWPLYEFFDY